jgi:hypothetical protein
VTDPSTLPEDGSTLASPLTLLIEEERHGDRQAEEVLLLTYTSDLGFFEAFGLGAAQACGARVTVVGDARMGAPDPRASRRAGRSYLPGNAICGGAFHPKLVLIAGPERVTAAIGSGNATLPGWQANAELWTVLRGDSTSCPSALAVLAAWLRDLPDLVRFSHRVPEALGRAADHIEALIAQSEGGMDDEVRIVSNIESPILQQLPTGPVDELAVCAPFHDAGAVAVRALVDRLQPRQVRISYQPEFTELDGPAVAVLAAELDAELRIDTEPRYRHGKLIEWAADGKRNALTGSPNLSGAALLRSLSQNGNCELGVVTPVSASLLPEGGQVAPSVVRDQRLTIRERAGDVPLLLGASRVEQGLHVMFTRALPGGGHLELSPASSPPETWERVGNVDAGETDATVTVAAEGGSRLRLVITGEDGSTRHSNLVFVVDPVRALQLPGIAAKRTPTTPPEQLFVDPRLAERFFGDLAALDSTLPARTPGGLQAARERQDSTTARLDDDLDGWERYLDECARRLGHSLLRFALGLPTPAGGPSEVASRALSPVRWADETVSDSEAGLDDENVEDVAAEQEGDRTTLAAIPDLSVAEPVVRRRYRRWAERLTETAGQLSTPARMLVVRLLLWTAAAGAWDRGERGWVALVSKALKSLGDAELPPRVEPQVGSLAAVALSVLRAEVPRYTYTEESIAFERAANAVAYLLVAADPGYVGEYTQLLESAFGAAVAAETIEAVASDIVQNDPVKEAVLALAERRRDAHRHGERLLHVMGSFSNPLPAALDAVGAAQDADLVGAWASSTSGKWVLCIWQRPDLFIIDKSGPRLLWRHYRLSGLLTPRVLALQRSLEGATSVRHGPYVEPFHEARVVLGQLGLTSPDPPLGCT